MTSSFSLLNGIGQSMKHLSERQRVISENIANGETPGFKARAVSAPDFSSLVEAHGGTAVFKQDLPNGLCFAAKELRRNAATDPDTLRCGICSAPYESGHLRDCWANRSALSGGQPNTLMQRRENVARRLQPV